MLTTILFTALLFIGVFAQAQTSARIQGLTISADSLFRDNENESVVLEGKVQVVNKDQHISCDKARINLRAHRLELYGNAKVISSKAVMGGDQIYLDYESNTGLMINGYVQSGNVLFEGEMIQKTGENDFFVVKADYTTCNNCPSSWGFSGSQIRAELGGYAFIKNSILKFGSVPILWLPYLVVPLKSDRQTGLLTPQFEREDKGGFAIAQPVFFALAKNKDATYTFKNYEFRGPKSLLNYRYVLSDNSAGEFDTAFLRDLVFKDDSRINDFRSAEKKGSAINRWFLKYDHYLELPEDFVHRMQINNASDLQYPKDFARETKNHGDPAMENRMSITKNSIDNHLSVDSSYYINLLQSDPLGGNDSAVHRLPEVRFSQKQKNINDTKLVYAFDLDLVNFARSGPAYDDLTLIPTSSTQVAPVRYQTNRCGKPTADRTDATCSPIYDGKFDPYNDLIRTGQRLDIQPTIYYPMKVMEKIDIVPKLSFRETRYSFPIQNYSETFRRYVRAEVGTSTTVNRIYGDLNDPLSDRYKHEIQPEISYTTTPWLKQGNHPFWSFSPDETDSPFASRDSISDGDLGGKYGLQFDHYDRVFDRNLVTFAVTNRLVEKKWVDGAPTYKQIASLKVSQSYDAHQASRSDPNREPWSNISAILDVRLNAFETRTQMNYYPYQKVTNTSSRFRLTNTEGQFFEFEVNRQDTIVPGQQVDSSKRTETLTFQTGFTTRYLNLVGQFVYDANWIQSQETNRIKSWAYIAQIKPPGDCWLITLNHNQTVGGSTVIGLNFEFTFGGTPTAPLQKEALKELIF